MAGYPLIPPLGEIMDQVLSPQEAAEFTAHLKPLVESGTGRERQAHAYLVLWQIGFAPPRLRSEW